MKLGEYRVTSSFRLLPIAAMIAGSMALAGCGDDNTNSTSTNGPGFEQVEVATGTVIGRIVDSNGNGIPGATVAVGNTSVSTNNDGTYQIDNVRVSNTVGGLLGTPATTTPFIPVAVTPPAGYVGATIRIRPEAQIFEDPGLTNGTNPIVVFVDGYSVDGGTVRLPALTTTVRGTVREAVTATPLANQKVTLDFATVLIDQSAPSGGITTGYEVIYAAGPSIVPTQTDANGNFEVTGLADDSCYVINVEGYALGAFSAGTACPGGSAPNAPGTSTTFTTTIESDNTVVLGESLATAQSNADVTPPFATRVSGVPNVTAVVTPGQLVQGANQTLQIDFSEAIAGFTAGTVLSPNTVVVQTGAGTQNVQLVPSTATVIDANTIEVALSSPIPENGVVFTVDLDLNQFADASGNLITTNNAVAAAPIPAGAQGGCFQGAEPLVNCMGYDAVIGGLNVLRYTLRTYNPLDTDVSAATVSQQNGAVNNPATDNFFAVTKALSDFIPGTGLMNFANQFSGNTQQAIPVAVNGYEQLNTNLPRVQAALNGLTDILADRVIGGATGPVVDINSVAADLTFGSADHYVAWVEDPIGNLVTTVQMSAASTTGTDNPRVVGTLEGFQPGVAVPKSFSSALNQAPGCSNPTPGFGNDACAMFVISKGNAANAKLYITDTATNLAPGTTLHVIARSASGFTGNEQTVTLVDTVPPTAVAQFFSLSAGALNSVNSQNSGSGGTTINLTTNTGQVIFPITPQAFEATDQAPNAVTGLSGDTFRDASEPQALSNGNLTAPAAPDFIADATGMTAFLSAPTRSLALTVSEPVAVINGTTATQSAGSTAPLSGYQAINNGVDELNAAVDTLAFTTNILQLENDGRAKGSIDFSPVFTDTSTQANQADGAMVSVRDFMPPFMTKALFDGRQFVFRFHEAARGDGTAAADITVECGVTDVTIDLDATGANVSVQGVGTNRIVVPLTVGGGANAAILTAPATGIGATCFTGPSYAEPGELDLATLTAAGDTTLTSVADNPPHGQATYGPVRDMSNNTDVVAFSGNSWAGWNTAVFGMGSNPQFAIANVLPPFIPVFVDRGASYTNGTVAPATFNVSIRTSIPFFLTDGLAADPALSDDAFGDDADEAPYGDGNGNLTNAELLLWAQAKFRHMHAGVDQLSITGAQVIDSNGNDVLGVAGNPQTAQLIILTITPPLAVDATDLVEFQPGQGLSSQFDNTNANTSIYRFDEAPAGAGGQAGRQDIQELNAIGPISAVPLISCPQATPNGAANEC